MASDAILQLLRFRREHGPKRRRAPMPRQEQPDMIRLDYLRELQSFVDATHVLVVREVYPVVRLALPQRSDGLVDDVASRVSGKVNQVARQLSESLFRPAQLESVAAKFGKQTSEFQKLQLNRQVRSALGVDLKILDPGVRTKLDEFTTRNVQLIKSLPSDYLSEVQERATQAAQTGQRWESLQTDLEERFGVASSRAALIARDQVGKFFGEVNKVRQEALGIEGYIWRTANDNRVRDEHEEREGVLFTWDDPPEDGAPGEPIQCRCYGEPDLSAILASL